MRLNRSSSHESFSAFCSTSTDDGDRLIILRRWRRLKFRERLLMERRLLDVERDGEGDERSEMVV